MISIHFSTTYNTIMSSITNPSPKDLAGVELNNIVNVFCLCSLVYFYGLEGFLIFLFVFIFSIFLCSIDFCKPILNKYKQFPIFVPIMWAILETIKRFL